MTKITTIPIYGVILKKFSIPDALKLGIRYFQEYCKIYWTDGFSRPWADSTQPQPGGILYTIIF